MPVPQATPGIRRSVSRGSAALLFAATLSLGALGACKESVTPPPTPVARVILSEQAFTLGVGRTKPLAVTLVDVGGALLTGRTISYATSNPSVAGVSLDGVINAVGIGNATITVTSEGKSAQAQVSVVTAVASVSVAPSNMTLVIGSTQEITASCVDAQGVALAGRLIEYSSSNLSIASVTATGVVAAVAQGNATITVSCEGKSNSVGVAVNDVPVASVEIAPVGPHLLRVTNTRQLSATTKAPNGTVLTNRPITWTSSNQTVATVSSTGLVTALAPGSTTVRASSENRVDDVTINVTEVPIVKVEVVPVGRSVLEGEIVQLAVTLRDSANNVLSPIGRSISWRSDNNPVATVNSSGVLLGVAQGSATITATATAYNVTSNPQAVSVIPVPVKFVEVDPEVFTITAGRTQQMSAVARDSIKGALGGRLFTWQSSNQAVVTVSTTGLLTAVGVGTATVSATTTNVDGSTVTSSPSATVTVSTVVPNVVQITPPQSTLRPNETAELTATVRDAAGNILTGRAVEWFSSNTQRATVVANPNDPSKATVTVVQAPTSGSVTVTITATVEGRTDTATITITSQQ